MTKGIKGDLMIVREEKKREDTSHHMMKGREVTAHDSREGKEGRIQRGEDFEAERREGREAKSHHMTREGGKEAINHIT